MSTNSTTRLLPPALPARLVIIVLSVSLLCLALPQLVQAAPARANVTTSSRSAIAHVDVTRLAADGKSETSTRLSVRVTDNSDASELQMNVGAVHYQLKVGAHQQEGARVVDLELRVRDSEAGSFELSTRSISTANTTVLLARNAQVKVALTLE